MIDTPEPTTNQPIKPAGQYGKKIIITIVAVLIVVFCALSTLMIIKFIDVKKDDAPVKETVNTKSADSLKQQAIKELTSGNKKQAKSLFESANQQYKTIGDKNNQVDTAAQIYLIDHAK